MERLLKEEKDVKNMANAFVQAKEDQQFWPGLLNDLRNHFSSEFTWVTDLDPLYNYDPTKPNDPKIKNGESLVKPEFANGYGLSLLSEIKMDKPDSAKDRKKPALVTEPEGSVPMANAVRIKGLWRQNSANQNAVNNLIKKLRESNSGHLRFNIKGADDKDVALKDEQIVKILQATTDENKENYAWPFEIIIPLSRPVAAK